MSRPKPQSNDALAKEADIHLPVLWDVRPLIPSPIPILYNHWMGKEQYQQHSFLEDPQPTKEPRRKQQPPERQLREAIERYVDVPKLRQYASDHERLTDALKTGEIPRAGGIGYRQSGG